MRSGAGGQQVQVMETAVPFSKLGNASFRENALSPFEIRNGQVSVSGLREASKY